MKLIFVLLAVLALACNGSTDSIELETWHSTSSSHDVIEEIEKERTRIDPIDIPLKQENRLYAYERPTFEHEIETLHRLKGCHFIVEPAAIDPQTMTLYYDQPIGHWPTLVDGAYLDDYDLYHQMLEFLVDLRRAGYLYHGRFDPKRFHLLNGHLRIVNVAHFWYCGGEAGLAGRFEEHIVLLRSLVAWLRSRSE